ncbi:MAG: histidinol-phosphate aminotransferase family protein [Armatimonadetes bacterium]|nr:histidinol-phosphate aminotransferase family protein [Armatimonadota bacterium]
MKTAGGTRTADAAALVRPEIRAMRAYRLAQPQGAVRLHQNEAPDDWPEEVKRAIVERVLAAPWHRYPSARADAVCEAVGQMQQTPSSMIAATAGSNEALWAACSAFAARGTVVMSAPTYSMARTLAIASGARVVDSPLGDGFGLNPDVLLRAAHAQRAELIYLASPNNPTGNAFPSEAIRAVVEGSPGAVVLDEAYWEFASASHLDLVSRFSHVLVVRTFSKAMGGAGLRVGWITAQAALVAELHKVIPPYSLNVFAQIAIPVLVARREMAGARVQAIVSERGRVARALEALGMRVYPSETNFLLFSPGRPPAEVWQGLADRGVLVRDVSRVAGLEACLRVSIGSVADNGRFLAAIGSVVAEGR